MNYSKLLPLALCILFSCQDKSSTNNVDKQDLSESQMKSFFDKLDAKELKPSQIINYTSVATQGVTGKFIDQLVTTNSSPCNKAITKLEDLNDGAGFENYKFYSDKSADAKALGFDGTIGKKEFVLIKEYTRYKIDTCSGSQRKIGVSLRSFIHVKSLKGTFAASLPNIAGSVQLNRGDALFTLKSIGFAFDTSIISEGFKSDGSFDVQNFSDIQLAFENAKKMLKNGSKTKISPTVLIK